MNTIGPDPERTHLSMKERGRWIAFLALEVRQDAAGRDAQMGTSGALASTEVGGWCGCNGHTRALEMCLSMLWLKLPG